MNTHVRTLRFPLLHWILRCCLILIYFLKIHFYSEGTPVRGEEPFPVSFVVVCPVSGVVQPQLFMVPKWPNCSFWTPTWRSGWRPWWRRSWTWWRTRWPSTGRRPPGPSGRTRACGGSCGTSCCWRPRRSGWVRAELQLAPRRPVTAQRSKLHLEICQV